MPFGKYKGRKMENVPPDYLLWLWDEGIWAEKEREIHTYIRDCFDTLVMDAPDFIVKHLP